MGCAFFVAAIVIWYMLLFSLFLVMSRHVSFYHSLL